MTAIVVIEMRIRKHLRIRRGPSTAIKGSPVLKAFIKSYMQLGHGNVDCGSCLVHFPARYVHALCVVPAPSMQIWLRGRPTSLLFRLVPLTIAFNSRFNHVWSLDRHPWARARWWRRRTANIVCPEVFKSSALRMGIIRESFRGRVMTFSTIVIGREMLEQRPPDVCFGTRRGASKCR
jgi:hypothetical protein